MHRVLDLRPEHLPLTIRVQFPGELKEYVLVKTKQGKLLLNKPNGGGQPQIT
jgi:hypothetical protein